MGKGQAAKIGVIFCMQVFHSHLPVVTLDLRSQIAWRRAEGLMGRLVSSG